MLPEKYYKVGDWQVLDDRKYIVNQIGIEVADSDSEYPDYYEIYVVDTMISDKEIENSKNNFNELQKHKIKLAKMKLSSTVKDHIKTKMFYSMESMDNMVNIETPYLMNQVSQKWEPVNAE